MARKLSELEVRRIAEEAEIIVCGYAFTALEGFQYSLQLCGLYRRLQ